MICKSMLRFLIDRKWHGYFIIFLQKYFVTRSHGNLLPARSCIKLCCEETYDACIGLVKPQYMCATSLS